MYTEVGDSTEVSVVKVFHEVGNNECLMPEKSLWLEFIKTVHFEDPRLVSFPTLFRNFYEEQLQNPDTTLIELIDDVITKAYSQYSEAEAYEICKFYLFTSVLTQYNEKRDTKGNLKTQRKNEKDINGIPFPTLIHPTRVMHKGLDLQAVDINGKSKGKRGVKPYVTSVLCGHDLYEDCSITIVDDKMPEEHKLEKDELLSVIRNEFVDGVLIANSIVAMTKYEDLPAEMEKEVQESLLMKVMLRYIPEEENVGNNAVKVNDRLISKKQYDDIMKSTTSILRLRLDAYQRYIDKPDISEADIEAYIDEIVVNLYTKIGDIVDNTQTGVSFFSEVRARMMATIARVLMLEASNDIMHNLALHSKDALFENLQNKELAQLFEQPDYKEKMDEGMRTLIKKYFDIDVQATTGYRISFIDEAINADDPPHAVAQILLEVDPSKYDQLVARLSLLTGIDDFRSLLKTEKGLIMEKYNGVLQNIIAALGRPNSMFEVKEFGSEGISKDVIQYIRVVSKEPNLWERMLRDKYKISSPEEKFFAPPSDLDTALQKYLYMQTLLLNAEALKDQKRVYVLISDKILTTCECETREEFNELCTSLGITEETYCLVELMNPRRIIDWEAPPEYPFYYAIHKGEPTPTQQADFLQSV